MCGWCVSGSSASSKRMSSSFVSVLDVGKEGEGDVGDDDDDDEGDVEEEGDVGEEDVDEEEDVGEDVGEEGDVEGVAVVACILSSSTSLSTDSLFTSIELFISSNSSLPFTSSTWFVPTKELDSFSSLFFLLSSIYYFCKYIQTN